MPTSLKAWLAIIGGIIATLSGGVALVKAYPEYYYVAHRGYVDYEVEAKTKAILLAQSTVERSLYNIQLEQAQGKHEAVDNDLFKAQLEAKKAQDPTTQEFINQQIIKLQNTKSRIESQIQTLERGKP